MDDNLLNGAVKKLSGKSLSGFNYGELEILKKALTDVFMGYVITDANKLYEKNGVWSDVYKIIAKRYKMKPRLVREWVKPLKPAKHVASPLAK